MNITKKSFLIALAAMLIVVLVGLGILLGIRFFRSNSGGPSEYSAVYLTSGDVYFGKLDWFPWPRLKEVWYLARNTGPDGQSQLSVVPFKNAFWGPMDEIYLNPKEILFWTRLRSDSQIVKAFQNPQAFGQSQTQPPQAQNPASTPMPQGQPGSFRGPSSPPPSVH